MHSELQDNGNNHSGTINPLTIFQQVNLPLCYVPGCKPGLRVKPEANTWED